jgi:tetratricopeptide (TPR) repeat protein
VFLAHASADVAQARVLYRLLEARGVRVCFDEAVLRGGDDWHALLPRYVRESAIVVALVSDATAQAHYARSEIVVAVNLVRREGRRLVPVLLTPGAELPYGTEQLHALSGFDDAGLVTVAEALAELVEHPERLPALRASQVWCSRVPAVTGWFTGRDDLLAGLAETAAGETRVLTQTVNGMGGVGKTTLAAAFAEAQRHMLDVVWWVRAEEPATLTVDLAELADRVGLPGAWDDPTLRADGVRAWLEETSRSWLVVFDNARDVASVERWRPKRGAGMVLVTSRSRDFDRVGDVMDVAVFPPTVAVRFLRERVAVRNPAAAAEPAVATVVERLGGLPLALEQAASWVARAPHRRFARYVELFDDASQDPFPEGTRPIGYEATGWTTWRVSIDAATTEAPLAAKVMGALGYVAPDELPLEYLLNDTMAADGYLAAGVDEVEAALVALHNYSLIELADTTLSVHRVVQAAARRHSDRAAAAFAVRMLRAQANGDAANHVNWPRLQQLAPHTAQAAEHAGAALPEVAQQLWWVLDDVATYLRASGQVTAAVNLAEQAAKLAADHLGPDHPDTLTSRHNLALAYQDAGQLERAIPLFEAVLADRRRVLGDDHLNTLTSRHSLAGAYQAAGQLERAIPLFEAVLADSRRVLGDDHPNTLNSRHSLAGAYRAAGQLERAIPLLEAVLTDSRRVLGDDHPNTLNSRHDLAFAYQAAGQLERAIPLLEAVLADSRRVLGDDHPNTLTSRNNLALAYWRQGRRDEAIAVMEAAVAASQRTLSPSHEIARGLLANLTAMREQM